MLRLFDNKVFATSERDVAAHFGVNQSAVQKWFRRGCPGRKSDGYDLAEIVRWTRQRDGGCVTLPGDPLAERMRLARLKTAEADATLRRITADERLGEVVSVDDVARGNVARARALRRAVDRLQSELPPIIKECNLMTCRRLLQERTDRMIDDYCDAAPGTNGRPRRKRTK